MVDIVVDPIANDDARVTGALGDRLSLDRDELAQSVGGVFRLINGTNAPAGLATMDEAGLRRTASTLGLMLLQDNGAHSAPPIPAAGTGTPQRFGADTPAPASTGPRSRAVSRLNSIAGAGPDAMMSRGELLEAHALLGLYGFETDLVFDDILLTGDPSEMLRVADVINANELTAISSLERTFADVTADAADGAFDATAHFNAVSGNLGGLNQTIETELRTDTAANLTETERARLQAIEDQRIADEARTEAERVAELTRQQNMTLQSGLVALGYLPEDYEINGVLETPDQINMVANALNNFMAAHQEDLQNTAVQTEHGLPQVNIVDLQGAAFVDPDNGNWMPTDVARQIVAYGVADAHLQEEMAAALESGDPQQIMMAQGMLRLSGAEGITITGTADPVTVAAGQNYVATTPYTIPSGIFNVDGTTVNPTALNRMVDEGQIYIPTGDEVPADIAMFADMLPSIHDASYDGSMSREHYIAQAMIADPAMRETYEAILASKTPDAPSLEPDMDTTGTILPIGGDPGVPLGIDFGIPATAPTAPDLLVDGALAEGQRAVAGQPSAEPEGPPALGDVLRGGTPTAPAANLPALF